MISKDFAVLLYAHGSATECSANCQEEALSPTLRCSLYWICRETWIYHCSRACPLQWDHEEDVQDLFSMVEVLPAHHNEGESLGESALPLPSSSRSPVDLDVMMSSLLEGEMQRRIPAKGCAGNMACPLLLLREYTLVDKTFTRQKRKAREH